MGKFALGKPRWARECHRGLEECHRGLEKRNEDQAIFLRAMGTLAGFSREASGPDAHF